MSSVEDKTSPADRPDVGHILARPQSPAVIRFLGCDAEMAGMNADFFTAGRTADCDLALPDAMGGDPTIVLRFSRGPEAWRVSPSDNLPIFVNQELVRGLTSLRSGDVIRFAPGGVGMQFSIVHQNATPLSSLVARYAPRLLGEQAGAGGQADTGGQAKNTRNDSAADAAAPIRYEAPGRPARPAAQAVVEQEAGRRIDPAVLVAASILLAGLIAGAAFVYTAPPIGENVTETSPVEPVSSEQAAGEQKPSPQKRVAPLPANPSPSELFDPQPPAPEAPAPETNPSRPAEPDDDPFSDL